MTLTQIVQDNRRGWRRLSNHRGCAHLHSDCPMLIAADDQAPTDRGWKLPRTHRALNLLGSEGFQRECAVRMAFAFAMLLAIAGCDTPTPNAAPRTQSSTVDHYRNLHAMGSRMIAMQYHADDDGRPLCRDELTRKITGGVSHVHVPDTPHQMEWRLQTVGFGDGPGRAAVSFLSARSWATFTHSFLDVTREEFHRIARGIIDLETVDEAMDEVSRKLGTTTTPGARTVSSGIHISTPADPTQCRYATKVRVEQWEHDPELANKTYGCEIVIYFVYLPPDRDIDLSQVSSGGFDR